MNVETIATSTVTASISATDYLQPFINEGDRKPSLDGSIVVFKNKSKRKEDMPNGLLKCLKSLDLI